MPDLALFLACLGAMCFLAALIGFIAERRNRRRPR